MKKALLVLSLLTGMLWSNAAQATCYIAYIHGKGTNLLPGTASDNDRENYWTPNNGDTVDDFVQYSGRSQGCVTLVTGYDGTQAFWDNGAAYQVASQINAFITNNNIPNNGLIIVGHSMGGVIGRWILNNGVGGSAYYNYQGANYANIVSHTRYLVTVASPHLGSPAADAVYGNSNLCGNLVGAVYGWLFHGADNATYYLQQFQMEYGSANGGWIQDAGRTRTMYTVATRRWDSGNGTANDTALSGAWDCLGNVGHWYNPWSNDVAGDGLVHETSGQGQYRESGSNNDNGAWGYRSWSNGQWIQGARTDWVHMDHNHNQVRYDWIQRPISNNLKGTSTTYWPGSYIGQNGLHLDGL